MQNTKQEILNLCIQISITTTDIKSMAVSSNFISEKLNISRSLASLYLNDLNKEGELIKIATRPVLFLYRKSIQEILQVKLKDNIFLSFEEIKKISEKNGNQNSFANMIGYSRSLNRVIEQFISALKFPGGLPIILVGEQGAGKSTIVNEGFKYGIENGLLSKNAELIQIIASKNQSIWNELMRAIDNKHGGIVYIARSKDLLLSDQKKLANLLETKKFYVDSKEKELKTNIILSLYNDQIESLDFELGRCFPVICRLPSFIERSSIERENIIIGLFKKKSISMRRNILITHSLLNILANTKFEKNIDELNNLITEMCANANNHSSLQDSLLITSSNIPPSYMNILANEVNNNNDLGRIDVSLYQRQDTEKNFLESLNEILIIVKGIDELNKNNTEQIMKVIHDVINDENLIKDESISVLLNLSFDKLSSRVRYTIPQVFIDYLSSYLYYRYTKYQKLEIWEANNETIIGHLYDNLSKRNPSISVVVGKTLQEIEKNFSFRIGYLFRTLLFVILYHYNDSFKNSKYLSIIVCHGSSTASSMASSVNELLGVHVFDAFDMPLNTTMEQIVIKLNEFINQYMVKNDVILMVDMGSLENIGEHLKKITNRHIGVINNVSTKMALTIGNDILLGKDMQTILEKTVKTINPVYTIVENELKKDVIIFVSENNITMAEKMKGIFNKSLPNKTKFDVIAMDLNDYLSFDYMEKFKRQNNILFVSGSCIDIKKHHNFIPIEDLISEKNIRIINDCLSLYFDLDEIERFNDRLLYNFSFENIIDSITILDAKRLMKFAQEAVENMEKYLGIKLTSSTKVGLYMHICCMIERLITKEPIKSRDNLEQFEKEKKTIISGMNRCLEHITKHYGINVPNSEIAYLYDYVKEDKKRQKNEK